jgi:hypothetical protein
VKEVATKTSDLAGDGTTTATVLAQAIFREGLKNVTAGANPTELKRGIEKGARVPMELKVGDQVIYGKYSGTPYTFDGDEYVIIKASDVLAKLG